MNTLIRKFTEEPAVFIAVVVGLLLCAGAVVAVLATGGTALGAVAAGIASLVASLTQGKLTRDQVQSNYTIVEDAERVEV